MVNTNMFKDRLDNCLLGRVAQFFQLSHWSDKSRALSPYLLLFLHHGSFKKLQRGIISSFPLNCCTLANTIQMAP